MWLCRTLGVVRWINIDLLPAFDPLLGNALQVSRIRLASQEHQIQPQDQAIINGFGIQQNLVSSNDKYASSFTKGDLALPPAKKYLVGKH